jgi:predicted pyridoxine 5'-phosphate oxidase superfamily flavin-nucleotide-binding protein
METTAFNEDERMAQRMAGFAPASAGTRSFMTEQHRGFFAHLSYLFVGVVDGEGWPLPTVLTGEPGFVCAPDPTTLRIAAQPDLGDAASAGFPEGGPIGVLGLDFSTRRRNRANGIITSVDADAIMIAVEQSFGNCPKYIQRRDARPTPRGGRPIERLDRLDAARDLIVRADHAVRDEPLPRRRDRGRRRRHFASRAARPASSAARIRSATSWGSRGQACCSSTSNAAISCNCRAASTWTERATRRTSAERSWRFHFTRGWRLGALALDWTFPDFAPTTTRIAGAQEPRPTESS